MLSLTLTTSSAIKFTIRTDHRNLLYIKDHTNAKVVRWKVFISEFDFTLQYLKGELNVPADYWSRVRLMIDSRHRFSISPCTFLANLSAPDNIDRELTPFSSNSNIPLSFLRSLTSNFATATPQQDAHIKHAHLLQSPLPIHTDDNKPSQLIRKELRSKLSAIITEMESLLPFVETSLLSFQLPRQLKS